MIIHTVSPGETIAGIASEYAVPANRIITDNLLFDPDNLVVGQTLLILFPSVTYTVRRGDTLNAIAERLGTTVLSIWQNNPILGGEDDIFPGQILNISYSEPRMGSVVTTGFAYPETDVAVLRRTMPYLTRLNIFTYGVRPDGTLVPADDALLIATAKGYDTIPIMVLSSYGDDRRFDSGRLRAVLDNPAATQRLIDEVLRTLREKGYGGVEADFEYLGDGYAEKYADFIAALRFALNEEGYILTVDLAPKTSDAQPGSLYSGIDYGALGAAADNSFLMTYEWGYRFSEPMAISPENKVREVVEYAVTKIPPTSILLGLPNYGYVWKLPFVEGITEARSLSNTQAVELARDYGASIRFDETAKSPYFYYTAEEEDIPSEYEVWFQDARTVRGALEMLSDYNLLGMGVWNIRRYFPQLWGVLNSMYEVIRG